MIVLKEREAERLLLQEALDFSKTQGERNKLGQFATPSLLARDVAAYCSELMPDVDSRRQRRMLEPALGTGAFWSAWLAATRDVGWSGIGIELDSEIAATGRRLWSSTGLDVRCDDFTTHKPPESEADKADLVISNPPYVRHHHLGLEKKARLRKASARAAGMQLSGLAGLYCHFVALSHPWMRLGALAAWLLPSEFMDVNYGGPLKRYLLEEVTLLRVHQFDPSDVQFDDALVTSAIVVFRNDPPPDHHEIEFTLGRSLFNPRRSVKQRANHIRPEQRWTQIAKQDGVHVSLESDSSLRLGDIFSIRRGLVTGGNEFFVLSEADAKAHQLPAEVLTPILPGPRYLSESEVLARPDGSPDLAIRNLLLDCQGEDKEVEVNYPTAWAYLSTASDAIRDRYICRHRNPWFRQERRKPAPLLCTYLGRGGNGRRPFRFILNHSNATAANVYHLLYPLPGLQGALERDESLLRKIWEHLNTVDVGMFLRQSRVYGGGLHKLEPGELGQVSLAGIGSDVEHAIRSGGLPEYPETALNATHQLLEPRG